MPLTQLKDANLNIPYVGGWCEGFVEGAWGQATLPTPANPTTSGVYSTAIDAWNAQPNKHYDLPPVGKTVPVYLSLGNVPAGHVAISLDDGKIASSSQSGYHPLPYFHPNLNDLIAMYGKYNGGCTYLGWGEYVGRIQVVSSGIINEGENEMIDQSTLNILFNAILGRSADPGAVTHYVGNYTPSFVANDLNASAERKTYLAYQAKAVTDLKAQLAVANKEIARLKALPTPPTSTNLDVENNTLLKKIDTKIATVFK